ncbi:MAG: sugar-transfer associated ATP-grasp domain-containing protein [Pseudomonadota bacterium]|nr:sugar-transfer associated ATP-grasp domain-containing protein [Pseudomonadota bacterium]
MTSATLDDKALLAVPEAPPPPPASTKVEVARTFGVTPIPQLAEMVRLNLGPGRLHLHEYYSSGLYDPAIPMAEKRQYVGQNGNWLLNEDLSPKKLLTMHNFVANKVMYTSLIQQLGFRTTETQAVVSDTRRFGEIPAITQKSKLKAFLIGRARYPIFGKPTAYSGSFGSVLIRAREGEMLVLGNGKQISIDAFCEEIFAEYANGYLLQTALEQHPAMAAITGKAVGSLRIVTVRQNTMPEVLYSLWKIPAPKAMSDNFWQDGSMIAPVDALTGQVGQCRIGTGLKAAEIDDHPVSGARITGFEVPHWDAARALVTEAHALFPEFGVIGWDVAMTPEGPAIIECNDNPFHMLYQLAYGRGIRNPEFTPVFDRVAARSKELMAERKAQFKQRVKKHRR